MDNINPFSHDGWAPSTDVEVKRLEFNFGVRIGWDGNQWVIEGYEMTFANLDEVRRFCKMIRAAS